MNTNESLINQAVAERLRELRGGKAMSLEALAEKSGVPLSNLRRVLKGQQDIGIPDLAAVAGALGSNAKDVVDDAMRNVGGEQKAAQDVQYILNQRRRQAQKKKLSVVPGTLDEKDPRDMTEDELNDSSLPYAADKDRAESLTDEPQEP